MNFFKTVLSYIYGLAVYTRNWLFDVGVLPQERLADFVISVGNIAVGGTGKSPVVVELVRYLQTFGDRFHLVVLTRGYKSGLRRGDWLCLKGGEVIGASSEFAKTCKPDEALMQSEMCPDVDVLIGSRRLDNAKNWINHLRKESPFSKRVIWILDDGYQHRGIHRDVDLLLLDAEQPFGALLPKGLFREPGEAICRADEIVFTRAGSGLPRAGDRAFLALHGASAKLSESVFETLRPRLASKSVQELLVEGQKVCLVSGLARNDQFIKSIKEQGFEIHSMVEFSDHAPIERIKILEVLGENRFPILTTSKDFSRSREVFLSLPVSVYVAELKVSISNELKDRIKNRLAERFGSC